MELSKDELKEAVTSAIAPLEATVSLRFEFLGGKVDEVREAQRQVYTREMVDAKVADVRKELDDVQAALKNLWAQVLAAVTGLWLILQIIAWVAAHAPK